MTQEFQPMAPYRWRLSDLDAVPKNGRKVLSTFSCGGGSSMGYKLAGFDVVAANDIDPEMARHYQANLHPKNYFLCPVGDLVTMDLPDELFDIDLLDGSSPCSTFSMAGDREDDWGINKRFREGQATQVLSDLFFVWLKVVERLKPKMVVAENVKGMLGGNAVGYTKMVMKVLDDIGYRAQLFLVNAADCGVPQRRERVFFVGIRKDIQAPPLKLSPRGRWISVGEALEGLVIPDNEKPWPRKKDGIVATVWPKVFPGESFAQHAERHSGRKNHLFTHVKINPGRPASTLTATCSTTIYHWSEQRHLSIEEFRILGAFPQDYVFESPKIGCYMIGMSVPPLMTKAVADAIVEQWVPCLPPVPSTA